MPRKKSKPKKSAATKVYPQPRDVLRFMATLLQKSRDINQTDKLALAELVKKMGI